MYIKRTPDCNHGVPAFVQCGGGRTDTKTILVQTLAKLIQTHILLGDDVILFTKEMWQKLQQKLQYLQELLWLCSLREAVTWCRVAKFELPGDLCNFYGKLLNMCHTSLKRNYIFSFTFKFTEGVWFLSSFFILSNNISRISQNKTNKQTKRIV